MGKFQQHAVFEHKQAWVGGEFGEKFARSRFGDDVVNALPLKKRGKYKGRINATIGWVKVATPGWVSTGRYIESVGMASGFVETRTNQIVAVILYSDTSYGGFVIHGLIGDQSHYAEQVREAKMNTKKAA